jgi:hypothetical protein
LVVFKGALILPSSTKFYWQDAWMNEDVENCYGFHIIASGFKAKFTRESQVVINTRGSSGWCASSRWSDGAYGIHFLGGIFQEE